MKNTFKEYHQYTEQEFKTLWENCLFVFDANALLNMYRYSRETVEIYFKVLARLKKNHQLWIPYQVGYEFYENRISVISENEKSYDKILVVLEKTKKEIKTNYKNHPFLDLKKINEEVKQGLSSAEKTIKKAQKNHPKWLENDEVLEKINELFKGDIGENYDTTKLDEIKKEGIGRYDKKIPPGFKDDKKDESKKFGDLILWYQIIDKATESKKPIVFISGDVKEDWWLEKDGKRLMPLPQLKKEMYDKANVDFHIYTADRFLELSETDEDKINERTIKEVRKIRESEEERMIMRRRELMESEGEINPRIFNDVLMEYVHLYENLYEKLERLFMEINDSEIHLEYGEKLYSMLHSIRNLRNKIIHGEFDRKSFDRFYRYTKEMSFILERAAHSDDIHPRLSMRLKEYSDRLEDLNRNFRRIYKREGSYYYE